jgi:WD40 repeat protein
MRLCLLALTAVGLLLGTAYAQDKAKQELKKVEGTGKVAKDEAADKALPGAEQGRTDLYGDPLPPGALARLGTVRFRHPRRMDCLAFSPTGKVLVSGGFDPSICFWDLDTGKEVRRFAGPGEITTLVFSPEGGVLAAAGPEEILLLNSATGKERVRLKGARAERKCLAFSPGGKVLTSLAEDGRACLWEVATGKKLREFNFPPSNRAWCALAPDGSMLASVDKDNVIHLWDVAAGKEWCQLPTKEPYGLPAFSPDGKTLAFGDQCLVLWEINAGRVRLRLPECGPEMVWAFSPDSATLAVGRWWQPGQSLSFWDTVSGKRRPRLATDPVRVASLTYSPDGKLLAGRQWSSGTIHLWDAASGKELHPRPGHGSSIFNLTFLAGGKKLVSAGRGGVVRLWEPATSRQLRFFDGGGAPICLALGPDEKQLVLGSDYGEVELYQVNDGKSSGKLPWDRGTVFGLACSSEGKCFVCSDPGLCEAFVGVYDLASRKPLSDFRIPQLVYGMALSPDDRTLILGGLDCDGGVISLFDCERKKLRLQLRMAERRVDAIAISPDGKWFAARGSRPAVTLWETVSGKLRLELAAPDDVWSVAFAPDGNTLAVGTRKGTIDLWEVATGKLRFRIAGPPGVASLAFAPDGRTLASAPSDHTILIWDVTGRGKDGGLPPVALTAKDLAGLWQDLAGDGLKAHQAVWTMVAGGKASVQFLQQHLAAVAAPDAAELKRLLADLDANQFKVREQATQALAKLHDRARPSLEEVLRGKPALELRKRVEQLLQHLDGPVTLPEERRGLRAVEVLEQIGTAEARQLLTALAKGLPEARLTQEAKASLKRLTR